MVLAHVVRAMTADIDGWVAPENFIDRQIQEVGRTLGDERWSNEQALMYFPDKHPDKGEWIPYRSLSHLVIQTANERTMSAMKGLALRGGGDRLDSRYLAEILSVRTADDAMTIIAGFYHSSAITPRVRGKIQNALIGLHPGSGAAG